MTALRPSNRAALAAVALLSPLAADAAAPALVPVTGFLTDDAGAPITDSVAVELALYTDATTTVAVWSEVQAIDVVGGQFTVYLGEQSALDLAEFRDNSALYLGISVGTGAEMTPRTQVATAPFAGFAQYGADAVTVGGVDPAELMLSTESVDWSDLTLSTLPTGLADGDNDTTYTAAEGLSLSGGAFSADQPMIEGWVKGVTFDTLADLRTALDAVYAAKQACTTSQVLLADSSGAWLCTAATALPLSEAAVDTAVANNGYAAASGLTALTARATTAEGDVTTLKGNITSINGTVTTTQGNIAALTAQISAPGRLVDYRYAQTNTALALAGTIPWDDSVPQITEGNELLTVTITPKKATNLLVINGTVNWTEPFNTADYFTAAVFRDSLPNAIATNVDGASNGNGRCTANGTYSQICTMPVRYTMVAGSTATTTLRLRVGINAGVVYINQGFPGGRKLGGALYSTFSVTEIAQ